MTDALAMCVLRCFARPIGVFEQLKWDFVEPVRTGADA